MGQFQLLRNFIKCFIICFWKFLFSNFSSQLSVSSISYFIFNYIICYLIKGWSLIWKICLQMHRQPCTQAHFTSLHQWNEPGYEVDAHKCWQHSEEKIVVNELCFALYSWFKPLIHCVSTMLVCVCTCNYL